MNIRLLTRRNFLALSVGSAISLPLLVRARSSFTVYDSLSYSQKPNIGLPKVFIYGGSFWKGGDRTTPDETACRQHARYVAAQFSRFVIDIEHWPIDIRVAPKAEVQESIRKLIQIVTWMKSERPNLPIGLYSFPPIRDYWTPSGNKPAALKVWRDANEFLRPIAQKVDFLAPSLYTFYDNPPGWVTYASANIAEAKRFGKPVIPVLWPRYHVSNKALKGTLIPGDFWLQQLQTVRAQGANGVILWDFALRLPSTVLDPSWDWWKQTANFVKTL